jgi:hypothetical protein
MSSIVVAGDTSGTVTLQAPAVSGSTVLNLPTISGGTMYTSTAAGDLYLGATDTSGISGQLDKLRIIGTTGPNSSISQFRYTNDNGSPNVRQYKSRGTTVGSFTAVQSADNILALQGYASDGTAWINSAQITFTVGNTVSTGVVPSNITFNTTNAVGVQTTQAALLYSGDFQFNSGYGSLATAYGCRAWVNFNGTLTGTITPRASGGVTSVTKNGTGDYTINLSFTMPDANYATTGNSGTTASDTRIFVPNFSSAPTTTSCRVATRSVAGGATDDSYVNVAIFR